MKNKNLVKILNIYEMTNRLLVNQILSVLHVLILNNSLQNEGTQIYNHLTRHSLKKTVMVLSNILFYTVEIVFHKTIHTSICQCKIAYGIGIFKKGHIFNENDSIHVKVETLGKLLFQNRLQLFELHDTETIYKRNVIR